jgi:hypothetical protein
MAQVVHVETLRAPHEYAQAQLLPAFRIQYLLGRGKLTLAEPPVEPLRWPPAASSCTSPIRCFTAR